MDYRFCLATLTICAVSTVSIRKGGLTKGKHTMSALTISASRFDNRPVMDKVKANRVKSRLAKTPDSHPGGEEWHGQSRSQGKYNIIYKIYII